MDDFIFVCFLLLLFISFCVQPSFLHHSRLFCLDLKFFFLVLFSGSCALYCNASLCNWRCNYLPELIIIIMIWIKCRFQHLNITADFVLVFSIFNEWLWIEMKNINRMICDIRYAICNTRCTIRYENSYAQRCACFASNANGNTYNNRRRYIHFYHWNISVSYSHFHFPFLILHNL